MGYTNNANFSCHIKDTSSSGIGGWIIIGFHQFCYCPFPKEIPQKDIED